VQILFVASISAALISGALTIEFGNQTAVPILFWPDSMNFCITFSIVSVGMISPLLGYYHLGRLGFLLTVVAGLATSWLMAVCAVVSFVYLETVLLSFATYAACLALAYMILVWLHLRAARSSSIREAQRKLRLAG